MGQPASGQTSAFAIGPELQLGAPNYQILAGYEVDPEGSAGDVDLGESESSQISRSGIKVDGVPGPAAGKIVWKHPLTTGHLVEPLAHILGDGSVVEVEAAGGGELAVQQYTLQLDLVRKVAQSFYAVIGRDPVDRYRLHGIKYDSFVAEIGNNTEIPVTVGGIALHKTELDTPVADGGNLGAYLYEPTIRGPLADPAAGDIHVQVSALAPLQFKVEQGAGPTWLGPAAAQTYDEDGNARWVAVVGADGADLGRVAGANKDPLMIMFPGNAADHADLTVGDTWTFAAPGTWATPNSSTIVGPPKLTSAHWTIRLRDEGAVTPYLEYDATGGTLTITAPHTVDGGSGSRYGYAVDLDQGYTITWKLTRSYTTRIFQDLKETGDRLDCELEFAAHQIGQSNAFRESLVHQLPAVRVIEAVVKASKGKYTEEITLEMREPANPALNPSTVIATTTHLAALPIWI